MRKPRENNGKPKAGTPSERFEDLSLRRWSLSQRVFCGVQVGALESQELRTSPVPYCSFLPESQPGIVIIFKLLKEINQFFPKLRSWSVDR